MVAGFFIFFEFVLLLLFFGGDLMQEFTIFFVKIKTIEGLKKLAVELGRTPIKKDAEKCPYLPRVEVIEKVFCGWTNALRAAGLKTRAPVNKMTKEKILEGIRRFVDENGKAPTKREVDTCKYLPSYNQIATLFGTYRAALACAGVTSYYYPPRRNWTREGIIECVTRFMEEKGDIVTSIDLKSSGSLPSYYKVLAEFGNINELIAACGYSPRHKERERVWTDDMIIDGLKKCAMEYGHIPLTREINDYPGLPSTITIMSRFGSVKNALALAGMKRYPRWNKDTILEAFKQFYLEKGFFPLCTQIDLCDYLPSRDSIVKYFGSVSGLKETLQDELKK